MKRQKPRHGHGRSAGVRLFGSRRASILVCVIAGVLAVAGILAGVASAAAKREREARLAAMTPTPTETPSPTPTPTPTLSPSPTPEPTPTPSPTPEPEPETFLISFAGDCTLGDDYKSYGSEGGFVDVVGTDYGYPFRGVMDLFGNDEVTFVNLEGVLSMDGYAADKLFCFRASEDYVKVLTEGSVELVTLANNHSEDFGEDGYDGTKKTLTDAGIPFVEDRSTLMFTSRNGLKLGIYAALWPSEYGLEEALSELREAGADLIICAFHWGEEGAYRPTDDQEYMAHVAIDCGADIVFGCHPHVLQPVEVYEGGVIYYSLGNFSFGGNGNPRDKDTAVIQQEVIREPDGTVHLGETILVPCRLSSVEDENDYQPVILDPKEDQEEYDRAMSKLDGTFDGPDLVVDYSSFYASPAPSADPGAPSGEDGEDGGAGSESGTEPEGETGTEPEVEAGEDGGSESEAEGGGSESPGEEPGDGGEDGSEGSGEGSGDGEEGGGTE